MRGRVCRVSTMSLELLCAGSVWGRYLLGEHRADNAAVVCVCECVWLCVCVVCGAQLGGKIVVVGDARSAGVHRAALTL